MRKAFLLAALTALPMLLAACSGPAPPGSPPSAHLALVGGRVNQQVTADPVSRQANELSVAVNPLHPGNIIATGKDYTQPFAGNCVWDGVYVTHDGGATWKDSNLPFSPWKAQADAQAGESPSVDPQGLSRFYCATDPVITFGPDGTAYWLVMPYQCDPGSGSPTGSNVGGSGQSIPPGGLNDWFWTCSSMYVLASTDGGDTWPTVSQVAFGPRLENDKGWIAATKDRVVACWDQDSWVSSLYGQTYPNIQQGTPLPPDPMPPNTIPQDLPGKTETVCSASTDKGATWSKPSDGTLAVEYAYLDAGPDGSFWMVGQDEKHRILVLRSTDGLAWSAPVAVGNYTRPSNALMNGFSSLNGSVFRVDAMPSIAVDRSNGAFGGSLYVAWMDAATGAGHIRVAASHDGGRSWSRPAWIHDLVANDTGQRGDQFMPAVSVGPDGTVDLTWMDRRSDPANHLFDCYYAFSLDGGVTYSAPLRVSNVSSDEQWSHHQNGAVFLGDYRQVASGPGEAHPVWVDTRNHKADVYTATIVRPGANAAALPS